MQETPLTVAATVQRGSFTLTLNTTFRPGSIVAVLGPNGSGKTTLLRAIAGLEYCTQGEIRLGNRVLSSATPRVHIPPQQRPVGLVYQDYLLFPFLTAQEDVAYGLRNRGLRKSEAMAQALTWLTRLDVGQFAHRRPAELSGGQQQRVALARALAYEPDVLLLDEPLAAHDVAARMQVRTMLREFLTDFHGITLIVTHDPIDAMVLADDVLVLERGELTQSGTPASLTQHPATNYVADLMGLNLISGQLQSTSAGTATLSNQKLSITGMPTQDLHPHGPVLASLRPSAITVFPGREESMRSSAQNRWFGHIEQAELLGDRVRLNVLLEQDTFLAADVTLAAMADPLLAVGQSVTLSAKATEIAIYPASVNNTQ